VTEKHPLDEIIDGLIETFGGEGKYVTLIIGVLVGDEKEVKTTEEEFDEATHDLLSANGFIKLGGYKRKMEVVG